MKQQRKLVRVMSAAIATLALCVPFGLQTVSAANPAYGTCQTENLTIAQSPGGPANLTLAGTYCTPTQWASGTHGIDVLMHGATYNQTYWGWPQNPSLYSYVDKTLQAGRATFAIDALGAGQSSKPSGLTVTVDDQAYALHQALNWVHQTYSDVTVVGHSFGSVTALDENATYQDASRLVITGLTHSQGLGYAEFFASVTPVSLSDPTYVTTTTAGRQVFYGGTFDQNVVSYDDAHKDAVPVSEITDLKNDLNLDVPGVGYATQVHVPVLVIVGQDDQIVCGLTLDCNSQTAVQNNEALYYTATPSLTTEVVPDTGHDLALHPSANTSFSDINMWIQSHQ
ncbi:MAG TPA: alpha/beta fold hydrolase [Candidatus Saccharimonadales bacterium]|jgi:pimeloyl-ACP methyl ester carboxylesterase|nr:alpha/beta fold hydrolase [Candidatus Saccharimonadales bacterium]